MKFPYEMLLDYVVTDLPPAEIGDSSRWPASNSKALKR